MALEIRKTPDSILYALAEGFNALKKEVAAGVGSAKAHADITSKWVSGASFDDPNSTPDIVTAADGDGTLAKLRTLCADIYGVYTRHLADALAHKVADAAPALTQPASTSALADLQTFLNAVKADHNAHNGSTTYHNVADAATDIAAADATDQASADTLANEIKADLNTHIQLALTTPSLKIVPA